MRSSRWQSGIHEESVSVVIEERGDVYIEWEEDQGGLYLRRVPCSLFVLRLDNKIIEENE